MADDLHYKSLLDVSALIHRREVSAHEVVSALLARIERYEPRLHSFLLVTGESALSEARKADEEIAAGLWRGPLHGVPYAAKDLLDVKGVPTTSGTTIMKRRIAASDATVVARLRRAGAIVIGKAHMTEGATLMHHPALSRPDNPWKEGYWTGVSSSGSGAATAAGFCYGAIGSDTGGSIRMPSGACGLSSFKPTWGRVSRHGVFPLAESFDHIGPMCRSVADAAAMLRIMAGRDGADPTALGAPVPDYLAELDRGLSDLTIGLDPTLLQDRVKPVVAASIRDAAATFKALGARVREITLPALSKPMDPIRALLMAEVRAAHAETYPSQAQDYGPDLRSMLDAAGEVSAVDVARAVHARAAFIGQMREVFEGVDLLLLPAAPYPTPSWAEIEALQSDVGAVMDRVGRYTMPFNATGAPTLSLPCGFTGEGLPLGLQLVGPHLGEDLLTRAGHAFQQATAFHTVHPSL
jgi:amidase